VSGDIEGLLNTAELPELGPERRSGTTSSGEIDRLLGSNVDPLLRATVLLWHDHLDEAHTISQEVKSADGSYLHGIMHRREPDYDNAKYWFNRVGKHALFAPLGEQTLSLLSSEAGLSKRLVPRGQWDPYAFIDACEEAENGRLSLEQKMLLRKIQAAELTLLFDQFRSH